MITRDSVVRQDIAVYKQSETFNIALPSEPFSFRFDEGGWLLGTVQGDLSVVELAQMAEHDLDVRGRQWALQQLAPDHDSTAAAARRFVVLNEHRAELRTLALGTMTHDSSDATHAVVLAALRDADGPTRATALTTLSALDPATAVAISPGLFATDPSNAVRGAALATIARIKRGGRARAPGAGRGDGSARGDPPHRGELSAKAPGLKSGRRVGASHDAERGAGLRTAALDALAASGDSARATRLALRLIADPDPLFARAAVVDAGKVGGAQARAALAAALPKETRVFVRIAMQDALKTAVAPGH